MSDALEVRRDGLTTDNCVLCDALERRRDALTTELVQTNNIPARENTPVAALQHSGYLQQSAAHEQPQRTYLCTTAPFFSAKVYLSK